MSTTNLNDELTNKVLAFLGIKKRVPATLPTLEKLLAAYYRTVPWESVFRIVRRADNPAPRWPEQFWQETMAQGAGGTCFESNYAFFALLQTLGYEGYLTINNMRESIGCHTASVIVLDGQKWLVDVGIPLYALLPISSRGVMHRRSPFLQYAVRPSGQATYQIEQRPHPKPVVFTLIDEPVDDATYRAATENDYGENGLFLDFVIINKVINNQQWRFNMAERPWVLNRFDWGQRFDTVLVGDVATSVALHFGMDTAVVQRAFALTQHNYPN
ncbi:arylamine N-acetyltransferase [Candidatus Leptofilum sp.]|uniref:arylamine N-acetyltransferase n=1 Tax=Candidatus Leptofilum sp. TaxID=3241576 RepID=UPI003B5A256C